MRPQEFGKHLAWTVCSVMLGTMILPSASFAATAAEIDASANKILQQFRQKHAGADEALKDAKGVLVFPQIVQGGFIVGGAYGEGVLRIHGKSVSYYSIGSGSFGLTFGAAAKAVIICSMLQAPLTEFQTDARTDKSWQVGLSGDIAVVNVGASGAINSAQLNRPIVAFTLDQQGLFFNLSLQGSKITKIIR